MVHTPERSVIEGKLPYQSTDENLHWARITPIYNRPVVCTAIGSLRFMPVINRVIDEFEASDIWVPAPRRGEVVRTPGGYKVLDVDGDAYPVDLERGYIKSLLGSDVGYIVNPDRYIGATSAIEALIARKYLIPVLAMEPLDPDLDKDGEYCELWRRFCDSVPVAPIADAKARINDLKDDIYRYRALEYLPLCSDEIDFLVAHILHMDWIKHRGLGAVVDWVDSAWKNRSIPHWGPMTRISEFTYDTSADFYRPDNPNKLNGLQIDLEDEISVLS